MTRRKTPLLKVVAPIAVLAIFGLIAWVLVATAKDAETQIPEPIRPLVRTMVVEPESTRLVVRSQGTVSPRTESEIVAEVSGRVTWVSAQFVAGGFFDKGVPLLRIDSHDYTEIVREADARVAQAELRLAREIAEAEIARQEWESLGSGETAPPLTLRVPQVAEAEATLEAARAGRSRAQRDLARTEVAGPYEGRIRVKHVDIGQFVNRGTPVATVYAVDYAEVRLPLPDSQLAYVDLPLDYRDGSARLTGPEVVLLAEFAGETHRYSGHIVRTEGEIDPRSRMVTAVAQVADPYARGDERSRPPLAAGMFVEAEIIGREVEDVLRLPRAALRQDGTVLLVDDDRRLRFRTVQVLRATDSDILVTGGLSSGDRICLSPLSAVTDGMQVRIAGEDDPS